MVAKNGQKYILDQSLSDFEKQTDPALFYRVIRKYLINLKSIKRIKSQPKSKLLLEVEPLIAVVIISGENAAGFKKWLEQ